MGYEKDDPGHLNAFDGVSPVDAHDAAFGAAGALGSVAGAALGILGGILGNRKQRLKAHEEAAAQWDRLRPQYEASYRPKQPLAKTTDPVKAARRAKVKAARKASRVTKRRAK